MNGSYRLDSTDSLISSDSGGSHKHLHSVPPDTYGNETHRSPDFFCPQNTEDPMSLSSNLSISRRGVYTTGLTGTSLPALDLIRPLGDVGPTYDLSPVISGSATRGLERLGRNNDPDTNNDPEGVRVTLARALPLDKNVQENSLPFVLYCYSEWAITSVFEPLKVTHTMREQVISQFSSENTRTRTILIANVMDMFAEKFAIDGAHKSILNHLTLDIRKSGAAFQATPLSLVPVLDRQGAIRILDNMLEIVGLQLDTYPTSDLIHILQDTTPIFRRACLELPGRPINLPNLLLDLSLNLRHFAVIDIIVSVITGSPTCVRYEVPFSLELCERVYRWQQQGNYGLQWLYGMPDQYLLLFVWINNMSETPGAGDNTELIASVERLLLQIQIPTDQLSDSLLHIGKKVVLESWRYTVPIYLYLVLCKANAHDPRVMRAQAGFMRLIRKVKPGRYPDVYLITSFAVVGVATTDERDRDTVRQRILGVREYAERGTAGNDIMLVLEDIWAQTRDEGRAAVWSDLTTTYSRRNAGH